VRLPPLIDRRAFGVLAILTHSVVVVVLLFPRAEVISWPWLCRRCC
jgi:hypothetical protein